MFMLKTVGAFSSLIFFQFAVVILHNEQSTSIEIYDTKLLVYRWLAVAKTAQLKHLHC